LTGKPSQIKDIALKTRALETSAPEFNALDISEPKP
jgi:hypothetical protein